MSAARARYVIAEDDFLRAKPLVIRDIGHDIGPSVTNDAENVVAELVADGQLPPGRRLFYIDSQGLKDELLIEDGKFVGFAPGGGEQ